MSINLIHENYDAIKTCRNRKNGTYEVEKSPIALSQEVIKCGGVFDDFVGVTLIMQYNNRDYRDANK